MNSPVQQIKERLSIEEVVSSYIKLEKMGANLKARCPFHNEKTPSFFLSPARGSYYCFGCGAKGDIFTFVEEFEGLDFKGTLKLLAGRAGVSLDAYSREEEGEKEPLYRVMEAAAVYFTETLNQNGAALEYLKNRGLTEETIKSFRIGFAKAEWRELHTYLRGKGFADKDIETAGLSKKAEGKSDFYDRFRGRIMFPITDSSGRVIAFSGRLFVDDGKSAKYLNSPETPIFSKFAVFYGIDKAKDSVRKNNFSILVEGQMDLVLSHQAGFKNTVATSGTALSDSTVSKENAVSNLGLVRRLSQNIVLAFDGDKAGVNATLRAGAIALSLGMDVKVAALPEETDPADLISKQGVSAWKEAIRNSKHLIEFMLAKVLKQTGGDARKIGREVKEKILPYVDALPSAIEQSFFLKKISDATSIPISALSDDLKKVQQELKYEKKEASTNASGNVILNRKDYILRRLLGIILWQETKGEKDVDSDSILLKLSELLKVDKGDLLKNAEESKNDLIFEAEVFYGRGADLKKDVSEMLLNLEEEYLKEELLRKMKELYLAEEGGNTEESSRILKEINEINNKIQNIKNGRHKQ